MRACQQASKDLFLCRWRASVLQENDETTANTLADVTWLFQWNSRTTWDVSTDLDVRHWFILFFVCFLHVLYLISNKCQSDLMSSPSLYLFIPLLPALCLSINCVAVFDYTHTHHMFKHTLSALSCGSLTVCVHCQRGQTQYLLYESELMMLMMEGTEQKGWRWWRRGWCVHCTHFAF